MIIETKRLVLRPHRMENARRMNKWRNDAELNYYDDDGPELTEPVPLERTEGYLKRIIESEDDTMLRFAIHLQEDESLIGVAVVALIDQYNKGCKIGLSIGEKDQWGKGYGREVVQALVETCFASLGLNRIGAEIYDFNQRSLRLFEGLGFKREGTVRQAVFKRGDFRDSIILGLLREEWKPTPARP